MSSKGWIGVDLDGTIAEYHGWKGVEHIGKPIPQMIERIKTWIAEGYEVRLFTARAATEDAEELAAFYKVWAAWCAAAGIPKLKVTCEKDYQMLRLYDDRAVQVVENTGEILEEQLGALRAHIGALTRTICKFATQDLWHFIELGLENLKSEAKTARAIAGLKPYIGV